MPTTQPPLPELDDVRFKRARHTRRAFAKARDALADAAIPDDACATCRRWQRVRGTDWGVCLTIRVQTVTRYGVEMGTLMIRPDDDRTLYGDDFEPFCTHLTFRACSVYRRIGEQAA